MPQRLFTKIGFFEHQNEERAVRVFKFRPTPSDESGFGKLFGLAECSSKKGKEALIFLEDILGEYYNHGMRGRWARGRELSLESLFEELLYETNEEWSRRQIIPSNEEIQTVVGLQKDNILHLAGHGGERALLFRERDGKYLQHFDLLKLKEGGGNDDIGLFSHVISGELLPGDAVVLLSEKFLDKLTLREVEKALMLNLHGGIALLEEALLKQNARESIGALILRRIAEDDNPTRMRQAISPHSSVESLRQTERSTEKILAPQTLPNIKEFLASIMLSDSISRKRNLHTRNGKPFTKYIIKFLKTILRFIVSILSTLITMLGFLFALLTNWHNQRTKMLMGIRQSSKQTAELTISSFNVLPRRSKTILLTGLLLIFLFTQSAMIITKRNFRAERERVWRSIYDDISAKREEIESRLVYGDENSAKTLFLDVERSLKTLENDSKKHEEEIKKMRELINQTAQRLYRVIIIDNTKAIADLNENLNADSLIFYKNEILAIGPGGAITINLSDKSSSAIAPAPLSSGKIIFAPTENNLVLALSPENIATLSGGQWAVGVFNKNKLISADRAVVYGDGLYILDQSGDNIWRYKKTNDGYGFETDWLKEEQELQSIVSFSIDSSMYLLDKNGTVRKFYRGHEEEFHTDQILPAFGEGGTGKILTAPGSNFLYVADPAEKRIIVWSKNGKLAAQYTSPKLDNLRDFAFDEKRKEIFVLNGNKILAFIAAHLDKK